MTRHLMRKTGELRGFVLGSKEVGRGGNVSRGQKLRSEDQVDVRKWSDKEMGKKK